jgi:beta-lactamase class A
MAKFVYFANISDEIISAVITISVIVNRKHEKYAETADWKLFKKTFPQAVFHFTDYAGHAILLAEKAAIQGHSILLAVGGDGTINEVVNGMMRVPDDVRKTLSLAIFPIGTGNDFVKSTGLIHSMENLIQAILLRKSTPIDLGSVSSQQNGKLQIRYFINIADAGIGGLVAKKFFGLVRWLPAHLAYHVSILRAFLGFKHAIVHIKGDHFEYSGKLLSLCAANGQWFGSGLGIAPHADIKDGNLAFVILGDVSLFDYLKYLPKVKKKEFITHRSLFYYKGKYCDIDVLKGENLMELDGEYLGPSPAKLKIHPKAISLIGMLCLIFLLPFALKSQQSDLKLKQKVENTIAGFKGDIGIYIYDLKNKKSVDIHADSIFPTASIVKVPILLGVMDKINKGELAYHQKLIYKDSLLYEGEDILGSFKDGETIELSKVLMLMLTTSDNTASLWLQKLAGTGTFINDLMAQLGFHSTRVNSRTPGRESYRDKFGWGQATPRELVLIFQRMREGTLLGTSTDDLMLKRLGRNYWDEEALSEIPAGIFTASKNGAVNASRSEVVLVNHPKNPYIFCIMTANNVDKSWEFDNEAWVLTRQLSKLLWQYYND